MSKLIPYCGSKERPVRVAIVLPSHWSHMMGGSQYQAKLLIDALHERGTTKVAYFAARIGEETESTEYKVSRTGPAQSLRRYGHFWDYFSLQKALAEFEPDIIYQRVRCSLTGIVARYARRHGIPLIWHVCVDTDVVVAQQSVFHWLRTPHRALERALGKYGVRSADHVIVQTREQRSLIRSHYGIQVSRVIPNFHPVPRDCGTKNSKITVVWIANLRRVKRAELYLEVASLLMDVKGVKFKIAGAAYPEIGEQRAFEGRVRELPNTEYLGYLSQDDVNALLEGAHVLVNTSSVEGLANTFIQAWMRRVPVLTLGANPDHMLDSGELGKSCGSVAELAETLRLLVRSPETLRSMGELCRKRSIERYSMNNVAELVDLILHAGTRVENRDARERNQPSLRRVYGRVVNVINVKEDQEHFVSFPKSGRTWIRMFLNHYYFSVYPFCVVGRKQKIYEKTIPSIKFSHGGHDDFGSASVADIERTAENLKGTRCIVLIRDPRDVLISYFFHLTKRLPESGLQNSISDLSDIIRHETLGFSRIIAFMNVWYAFAADRPNTLVVHYEDVQQNTEREFIRVLNFLGEAEVNSSSLRKAIRSTSFDSMKRAERRAESKLPYLVSPDVDDENSFKVRKGKVGGYVSYLKQGQIDMLNEEMHKLHPTLRRYYLEACDVPSQ